MFKLKPKEFVGKILSGERYFDDISLKNLNLIEYIPELNDYLLKTNLDKVPLILNRSNLNNLKMPGIYLPHTDFTGSNLTSSDFSDSVLFGSNFDFTDLSRANFYAADLSGSILSNSKIHSVCFDKANLKNTYFNYSELNGSSLKYAKISGSDLKGTDLRGVIGLDKIDGLEETIINHVIVTAKEKKLIEQIRSKIKFDLRNE